MKRLLALLIMAASCFAGYSQTNSITDESWWGTRLWDSFKESGIAQATNYAFEPYATYAPDVAKGDQIGGGALVVYNVNNFVGVGMGVDYLGRFSLVSANLTLKLPLHPFESLSFGPAWLKDITPTPFALVGAGKPLSGTSSQVAVITDVGLFIGFGHLWGGQFNVGGCYGRWDNADPYSGTRYHLFAGWSKGF